jgi:CheY-like chemotaxis protein
LNNALKFTSQGKIVLSGRLLDEKKNAVYFEVSDTGIGIDPQKQSQIFQPFFRAHSDTNPQYSGTGLGLMIVKKLVRLMGGEVSLKSKPQKGTTIGFYVQYQSVDQTKQASVSEGWEKPINFKTKQPNILVVEDNPIDQKVISRMLSKLNLKFDLVDNGQAALSFFDQNNYDLIFMDLHLPILHGLEVTSKIRTREQAKSNPPAKIIALTASAFTQDKKRCLQEGMDDYLAKPLTFANLKETLLKNF